MNSKTEKETRQHIIDKQLLKAGWDVNNPSQVTTELDIWVGLPEGVKTPQHEYQGHQYADYALLGEDGLPLAVVEAKKTSVNAEIGQEQALQYAQNIQKNTGKDIPFVFYTNGHTIYFWDTENYPPKKAFGYPTKKDLERLRFLRSNKNPLSQALINPEISGRPYQIEAIKCILEDIEKSRDKFLLVMATGTGKTRTCVSLIDVLMRTNRVQRVLFLVDRIALREQALDAFKEHLPNAPIWPKEGEKEMVPERRIYCATYKTILNIIEDEKCPVSPFFFDIIVADESHRSIYNTYQAIFDYFNVLHLGLTATPKDVIAHNTFKLFNCQTGIPTFAYTYEEAINNNPPYLSNFEALRIKSKFQKEGIRKNTISVEDQKKLLADGKDPEEINYEGTDLEKKVSNKGTNALIIEEFMDACIKDVSGTLPGKTIIFALSQKHAYRIQDVFNDLYPEHKGHLAKVIVSEDRRAYGKGGLLDQFKKNDYPRIAISVDMLDTGIDIREIVNLVFAKPVFSYTKFWQMIGRGTRLLEPTKIKPWCTKKDNFLVIDCWDNFEYFKMNPKGKESKPAKPLPVRLFESKLKKLNMAECVQEDDIVLKMKHQLQHDINELPNTNITICESIAKLEKLTDHFWQTLNDNKKDYLLKDIAPLMRTRTNVDFKAMNFELNVLDYSIGKLENTEYSRKKTDALKDLIVEKISELPTNINVVSKEIELITAVLQNSYLDLASDSDLDYLVEKIAPLMRYRDRTVSVSQEKLNLKDVTAEKEYIQFGPNNESMTIQKYQEKVAALIERLTSENEILMRIKKGEPLSTEDMAELANVLVQYDPYPTENNSQKAYNARQVKFLDLIKSIMGISTLKTFPEKVSEAFELFIATHNNTFNRNQIQFLGTLKTFIIENGALTKKDLVNEPFTHIHPRGFLGLFPESQQKIIIKFTKELLDVA